MRSCRGRPREHTGSRHGTRLPRDRLKVVREDFDEVRREEAHHPLVSTKATHPPGSIASIKTLYQITFDKAKVTLCLEVV